MEAQLDKKVLVLFNNVCRQNENSIEKALAYRQCSVKTIKSDSWFLDVKKILRKYQMNDIGIFLDNPIPIPKTQWKSLVNRTVNAYWYKEITTIVPYYNNLSYLNYQLYTQYIGLRPCNCLLPKAVYYIHMSQCTAKPTK